jgi:uncharacterized protein YnzC (UPF0291/DUF896 family)
MDKEKIKRINELAKKSKTVGLNNFELDEQKKLRREYIDSLKNNLRASLDNIKVVDKN